MTPGIFGTNSGKNVDLDFWMEFGIPDFQTIGTLWDHMGPIGTLLEGWKARRLEGWKVGRLESWKVGRLEGWKVGMEGWKVGRFGGQTLLPSNPPTFQPSNLPTF